MEEPRQKQFYIIVTLDQANTILEGLRKVVYEKAEPLIREISKQAQAQLGPQTKPAEPEEEEKE